MSFTRFQNEKTPFQPIKAGSSKSRKIDIFPKSLIHGFRPKIALFPTFIFQAIQARKMSFTIFYIEKTPLQRIKTKSSKSRKTDIFPKGITWFGSKNGRFCNFIFQAIQARKMSFTIFQNEKTLFKAIKRRCSKSRKIDNFPKGLTHGKFWSKNGRFSNFYFLVDIGKENVFYDILHRKNAFFAYKTKSSKSRKTDIFPRGLTHSFGPKMARFPTFFFQAIQARKMFFTILYIEKTPFQPIKSKRLKTPKTNIFPKALTHSYGPKLAILPNFLFRQYRPGNYLLRYSRTKNPLCSL